LRFCSVALPFNSILYSLDSLKTVGLALAIASQVATDSLLY